METPAEPAGRVVDPDSARWVERLSGSGGDRETAAAELHELLLRACRSELRRRSGAAGLPAGDLATLAVEAAGDATMAVLARLDRFRGESRFTTWAYAFCMFEVSRALARTWRPQPARLPDEMWQALPDRLGTSPEEQALARELSAAVRRAVAEELTQHQRDVFTAIVLEGIPLDALAERLGTNRNAIYKTMFDARGKIRQVLVTEEYITEERARGGRR